MSVNFPINEDPRFRISTAVGGETTASVPFPFQKNSDIVLIIFDTDGSDNTLDEGIDYTLTGAGDAAGGSATLTTPLTAGQKILRLGMAALNHTTSVTRNGRFSSAAIDDDLDRWVLIAQELRRENERSLRMPYGQTFPEFPNAVPGTFWQWNAEGTSVNFVDILNAGDLAVSPFMQGLLTTDTAPNLRNALALNFYEADLALTPAEQEQGRDNINAADADHAVLSNGQVLTAPQQQAVLATIGSPFIKSWQSAASSIAAGATYALTHDLGIRPKLVTVSLVCISADSGYSVADEILLSAGSHGDSNEVGLSVRIPAASTTTIDIKIGAAGVRLIRWDLGSNIVADSAKWQLIVKAWA
jgi:hypothetical protein